MMRNAISTVVIAISITGCQTMKEWQPTGGSRADGNIVLSYEYHNFEHAELNDSQGLVLAVERCKSWGYDGAEAFGGITKVCNLPSAGGRCYEWRVDKKYQCTGNPEK